MIIYGPVQNGIQYDEDLGPVLLSDWYHPEYTSIVRNVMDPETNLIPDSDNNLIQGKAAFNCPDTSGFGPKDKTGKIISGVNGTIFGNKTSLPDPGPGPAVCVASTNLAKFQVEKGKKYRLRLTNTGGEGVQHFSIDGHKMTIFANDFVPIKPYTTKVVTLAVGQRSDVVLEANGHGDTFWVRSNVSSLSNVVQPYGRAALYYKGADTTAMPKSTPWPYDDTVTTGNDDLSLTEPVYAIPVKEPDLTLEISIAFGPNGSGNALWFMNNQTFHADYNDPLLLEAKLNHTKFPDHPEWNVYDTGNAKTVRLIVSATIPLSHPMHLHGHDFLVLAQGRGKWDGTITRPKSPQRRDGHLLPGVILADIGNGPDFGPEPYIVLQYDQDNPGVWPFHCHIAWHVSTGLYVNLMERPADVAAHDYQIPKVMAQTCRDWWAFSNSTVVDEIDSGL